MRAKTPTLGATAVAFLAFLPPQWAGAEEIYRQTQGVSCLPDGAGCTTFQGYIYVHREGGGAAAVSSSTGGADPQFVGQRLYLHLGDDTP